MCAPVWDTIHVSPPPPSSFKPAQAQDQAGNFQPFSVTIRVQLVNDHEPILFLDGTGDQEDYSTTFRESQPYLGGPEPVRLSAGVRIEDEDIGDQFLEEISVRITNGM